MDQMPDDPWVQLKFRVRESLHAKIKQASINNSVPLNTEIVRRLQRTFEECGTDPIVLREELTLALVSLTKVSNRLVALMVRPMPSEEDAQ
jgi:hypothetical protein